MSTQDPHPPSSGSRPAYPLELEELEAEAVRKRREVAGVAPPSDRDDRCGLAMSGGGIRSATFHLGLLQAAARAGTLLRIDFMSTVSGGSYVGAFLGRLFDRLRGAIHPVEQARATLADSDSAPIRWLRRHGKYIAPDGKGDMRLNIAVLLRNFLTLHFVLLTYLVALFGVLCTVRYAVLDRLFAAPLDWSDFPIGSLVEALIGPFSSPWFALTELLVFFWALPCMFAYWLVSQRRPREFVPVSLVIAFALLLAPFVAGFFSQHDLRLFVPAFAVFFAFAFARSAWRTVDAMVAANGTGGELVAQRRPRQVLSSYLATAIGVTATLAALACADSIGHAVQQYSSDNETYARAFAAIGAALAAGWPMLRRLVGLVEQVLGGGGGGKLGALLSSPIVRGLLVLPIAAVPLTVASFAAHAAFDGGSEILRGVLVAAGALVLSAALTSRSALMLVNRTSLSSLYSSRLCRAYLGASNPDRRSGQGADVDVVMPGDDVARMSQYRPHEAGGPLHLINLCLNQTIEHRGARGWRDRKGESFAVSPLSITVGRAGHARWIENGAGETEDVLALGRQPGMRHPFVDERRHPDGLECGADGRSGPDRLRVAVEPLPLRAWVGISGAAFAPGSGWRTSPLLALLMTLANVRLGYWWDSGLDGAHRTHEIAGSFFARVTDFMSSRFVVQSLLIAEARARFAGTMHRHWYLSDGGFFDNSGLYELIRRRVPYLIAGDAGADPDYAFDDFSDLVRKVRIDFKAEVVPFTEQEIEAHVPVGARNGVVGTFAALREDRGGRRACHASLFWVRYDDAGAGEPARSVLLLIKAGLRGDEPIDVLGYQSREPAFPQQSTSDQFYDERQWESYRALGEHIGARLFADDPGWLFEIPLSTQEDGR